LWDDGEEVLQGVNPDIFVVIFEERERAS